MHDEHTEPRIRPRHARTSVLMKRLSALAIIFAGVMACGEPDPVRTYQTNSWARIDVTVLNSSGALYGPVYFTVTAFPEACGGVPKAHTGLLRTADGHRRVDLLTVWSPFVAACFELTFRPNDDPDRVIFTLQEEARVFFSLHDPPAMPDSVAFVVTLP
jgi:hypothetical protein